MKTETVIPKTDEEWNLDRRYPEAFICFEDKHAICILCEGQKEWVNGMSTNINYWRYFRLDKNCKHIWRKIK